MQEKIIGNNEWISVEDRLPGFDHEVLVFNGNNYKISGMTFYVAYLALSGEKDKYFLTWRSAGASIEDVPYYDYPTHWKELPDVPHFPNLCKKYGCEFKERCDKDKLKKDK